MQILKHICTLVYRPERQTFQGFYTVPEEGMKGWPRVLVTQECKLQFLGYPQIYQKLVL